MNSSQEISQEISNKEIELKKALNNLYILDQEKLNLQKDIINLQAKKKDIEILISKANHIVKEISIDIKLKTKEFWAARNENL